jgi:hypothetical protein
LISQVRLRVHPGIREQQHRRWPDRQGCEHAAPGDRDLESFPQCIPGKLDAAQGSLRQRQPGQRPASLSLVMHLPVGVNTGKDQSFSAGSISLDDLRTSQP